MGHTGHGMYDEVWTGKYAISYSTDTVLVFPNNSSLTKVRLSYVVIGLKEMPFYSFVISNIKVSVN
jgi:hypothetical protein